eukprot:g1264.t1
MNSIPRRLFGKNTAICFTGQHTFHYPGHGSHYPGMDFSLYKNNKIANKIVDEAEATLGFKISDILFGDKSNEKVARASHAQPAILLHSIIMLEIAKHEYDFNTIKDAGYEIAMGHSLGEYTALVATGAITLREGIRLVHKRGLAIQHAMGKHIDTNENQYGMYALMSTTYEQALDLCETINKSNGTKCNVANHNGKQHVVISGHMDAMDQVISLGKKKKEIRHAIKLDISTPLHSCYMKPAVIELEEALKNIHFNDPIIPIISNVTGEVYQTSDNIKQNLSDQVHSTVQWSNSMSKCGEMQSINAFHEFGPKRILVRLLKSHFSNHDNIYSFDSFCTIADIKQQATPPQFFALLSKYEKSDKVFFTNEIRRLDPYASIESDYIVLFKTRNQLYTTVEKFNKKMSEEGIEIRMLPGHGKLENVNT